MGSVLHTMVLMSVSLAMKYVSSALAMVQDIQGRHLLQQYSYMMQQIASRFLEVDIPEVSMRIRAGYRQTGVLFFSAMKVTRMKLVTELKRMLSTFVVKRCMCDVHSCPVFWGGC